MTTTDIRKQRFYYFTLDLNYPDVLICEFVKQLATPNLREAIIVKASYPNPLGAEHFLLIPRWEGTSFFAADSQEITGAYVFNGSSYLQRDEIDLANLGVEPIDIGALTPSVEIVRKWNPDYVDE
jgi:hypothetical protein